MDVKVVRWEETNISVEQLHTFIIAVFKERLEQGLNFKIATSTLKDFELYLANNESYTFIALDSNEDVLIGTSTIIIREQKGKKYGHHGIWAVKVQGLGIGRRLVNKEMEFAREHDLKYIESDTAVDAISSVKAHYKSGFHKAGYYSFPFTNYYSLYFRQICSDSLLKRFLFHYVLYPIRFLLFYLRTRLFYRENGSYTFCGRVFTFLD